MKLFLSFLLLSMACKPPLGTLDTMARFHGTAHFRGGAMCMFRSEDLKDPAFANRFHFLFAERLLPLQGPTWYPVTATPTARGTMTVEFGDVSIEFEPLDESISANMKAVAGQFETRLQSVTVTNREHGQELFISEPR